MNKNDYSSSRRDRDSGNWDVYKSSHDSPSSAHHFYSHGGSSNNNNNNNSNNNSRGYHNNGHESGYSQRFEQAGSVPNSHDPNR